MQKRRLFKFITLKKSQGVGIAPIDTYWNSDIHLLFLLSYTLIKFSPVSKLAFNAFTSEYLLK